ncbi:MAG: DUF3570 domain-containing protein [Melioribacteraceae bacterium]
MKILLSLLFCIPFILLAQTEQDTTSVNQKYSMLYKKRVLENIEIDLLGSFYTQDGSNAAVTGGVGTEELKDLASNLNISIPLNDDDVLTIDATISAYSSASSSNLNPFLGTEYDDDDERRIGTITGGTPWVASSGASKEDVWKSGVLGFSHSSDDRNKIYTTNLSFAKEYDYTSFGVGLGFTKLFNQKNTELGISANVYFDTWQPEYPIELKNYMNTIGKLNTGIFSGIDILNASGNPIDKNSLTVWKPFNNKLIDDEKRNTYSLSLSFSQILSKNLQVSIFADFVIQQGWLANPMQRVYFSDVDNFYIGNAANIINYTNPINTDVFQLADDIERLPDSRSKVPIGMRFNYFISENFVLNTYYRYYFDDWGINSHTLNIEVPIKISETLTLYPTYRFYNQTASNYFAPFEQNLSTEKYYTSDYDLSKFNSNQFGFGIKYTDIFTQNHLWLLGLKNVSLNYNYYKRNSGLEAHIISLGVKFIIE